MVQRITQGMLNTQLLTDLGFNMRRMSNLQNQLSTGKRINKPSDDPVGVTYSLRIRSELSANDQYQASVDSSLSWLNYTDSTLNQVDSVMQRARELAVQSANGSNPQSALGDIKSEVDQLENQLVSLGNTKMNGKYIFNGQVTDQQPYNAATASTDQTDTEKINYEVGPGVQLPINVTGDEVFGAPGAADNLFQVMDDFKNALATNNQNQLQQVIGNLSSRLDTMLTVRADVGAKVNRVNLTKSRLNDLSQNLQSLQSKVEDADVAQVITNLKTAQNVYQSSLSAGAKIVQPSLIDYIK